MTEKVRRFLRNRAKRLDEKRKWVYNNKYTLDNAEFEADHPRTQNGRFAKKEHGSDWQPEYMRKKTKKMAAEWRDKPEGEGKGYSTNGLNTHNFRTVLRRAVKTCHPYLAWRVSVDYHPRDYEHMKLFRTKGGSVAAVHDGDIVSVCANSNDSLRGTDVLAKAVANGGVKLDSFAGNHGFYTSQGFEPVSWCEWSDDYAPEAWKRANGFTDDDDSWKQMSDEGFYVKREPVVFYKYTGKKTEYPKGVAKYEASKKNLEEFLKRVPASSDYDEAYSKRDKEL